MDLISVIIPFYKKIFIKKTIDSVNQTHDNFEIIIIYDDPEKRFGIFKKPFWRK